MHGLPGGGGADVAINGEAVQQIHRALELVILLAILVLILDTIFAGLGLSVFSIFPVFALAVLVFTILGGIFFIILGSGWGDGGILLFILVRSRGFLAAAFIFLIRAGGSFGRFFILFIRILYR